MNLYKKKNLYIKGLLFVISTYSFILFVLEKSIIISSFCKYINANFPSVSFNSLTTFAILTWVQSIAWLAIIAFLFPLAPACAIPLIVPVTTIFSPAITSAP